MIVMPGIMRGRLTSHDGALADFVNGTFYTKPGSNFATAQSMFSWSSSTKWTRNSSGVLVASGSNTPAYEWDYSANALGVRVEGARTNLNTQSADQANAAWTKQGFTAAAGGVGPYNNTMTTLTETTTTIAHICYSAGWSGTAGTTYTVSFWVRKGTRRYVIVGFSSTGSVFVTIDTQNWTISQQATASGGATAVSNSGVIEQWGADLYRVSVSGSLTNTGSYFTICGGSDTATPATANTQSYLGNGSTVICSDAMSEAGTGASTYIPTTTASVTRNADSILRTTETYTPPYTIGVEYIPIEAATTGDAFTFGNSTDYNALYQSGSILANRTTTASVGQVTAALRSGATLVNGTTTKQIARYEDNNWQGCVGGTLGTPDTVCTMPTFSRVGFIGAATPHTGGPFFGHVRKLEIWNRALSDAELQAWSA